MNKNKVKVTIGNSTYFLVTDQSQDHINQAAEKVSSMMYEINEFQDLSKAAVLVALQLMSKLLLVEEEKKNVFNEQKRLMEKIESVI